jgi:hypothetical protein
MTLSARASTSGGIVRPICFAFCFLHICFLSTTFFSSPSGTLNLWLGLSSRSVFPIIFSQSANGNIRPFPSSSFYTSNNDRNLLFRARETETRGSSSNVIVSLCYLQPLEKGGSSLAGLNSTTHQCRLGRGFTGNEHFGTPADNDFERVLI